MTRLRLDHASDMRYHHKRVGRVPNFNWNRDNRQANLNWNDPDNRNDNYGVRSVARVSASSRYEFCFIHPPSMRPTSRTILCVWNIRVSFAAFNSRKSRNLKSSISCWLEAVRRKDIFICFGAFFARMSCSSSLSVVFSALAPKEYRHFFSQWAVMSEIDLYASYVRSMIGNDSIDLRLENIWQSWFLFRRGKKRSREIIAFEYYLEKNLAELHDDLIRDTYTPGGYRFFEVTDSKRRTIAVTPIRDRVVHRLLYEYLVTVFDHRFVYDAWSCRKRKGTFGALVRANTFFHSHPTWFVWRADITKFFDHVDRETLSIFLRRRISDPIALTLLERIISTSPEPKEHRAPERERERERERE